MGKRDILKHSFNVVKDGVISAAERPLDSVRVCASTVQESVENHITTKRDLQNLYRKHNFRLIQVTKHQDPVVPPRMKLVRPAFDDTVRQDLLTNDKRYYCISHCWGPKEELIEWKDSDILGVEGEELTVKIRPKKRETLLRLLETHGGYWWIDIFCAHAKYGDPPLEYMDDIYRNCKKCFALLDCPEGAMSTAASYISGPWSHIDKLPFYSKNNEVVDKYVEYVSKNTNNDEATNHDMLIKIMVETVYPDVGGDFATAITGILQCSWYSRVWTLQEATLPHDTVLMGEDIKMTGSKIEYRYISTIVEHVHRAAIVAEKRIAANRATRGIRSQHPQQSLRSSGKTFLLNHFGLATMERAREFCKSINMLKMTVGDAYYPLLLLNLSMTKRQCEYKRDYIFGVLGILGIRLSFTDDLTALWKEFLETLEPELPKHCTLPWGYDLSKASSLDDVFSSFNPKELLDQTSRWRYVSTYFLLPSQ